MLLKEYFQVSDNSINDQNIIGLTIEEIISGYYSVTDVDEVDLNEILLEEFFEYLYEKEISCLGDIIFMRKEDFEDKVNFIFHNQEKILDMMFISIQNYIKFLQEFYIRSSKNNYL